LRKSWLVIALLVFFVLNGLNGYTDLIRFQEPFILIAYVLVIAVVVYLISWMIFRRENGRKTLFSILLLLVVLFGKSAFILVKTYLFSELKASVFLSVTLLLVVLAGWWMNKGSNEALEKLLRYFSLLFIVLVSYEVVVWTMGVVTHRAPINIISFHQPATHAWNGNSKPNVYVWLLDEYQGNNGLKELTGFSNDHHIQYLKDQGFWVPEAPYSSYWATVYSLPSLFNMDTLDFRGGNTSLDERKTISASMGLQKHNTVVSYFQANNYEILTHSIFDLPGNPHTGETLIPFKWLHFQTMKTLPGWLQLDLLMVIPSNRFQSLIGTYYARLAKYNELVRKAMLKDIQTTSAKPKLSFCHFLIPHPPILKDSLGHELDYKSAMYQLNKGGVEFRNAYIQYIALANQLIREGIEEVNRKDPEAVVLIVSDHGLRTLAMGTERLFNIQWALRIPGQPMNESQNPALVNSFRIILNHIAGQELPMIEAGKHY
jgi:hypothetical protein